LIAGRELKRRIKVAARHLISGRESVLFEDEYVQFSLDEFKPIPSANEGLKRLNVVTPTLSSRSAFGGVATLIELPLRVFLSGLNAEGWKIRFICSEALPREDDNIALKYMNRLGVSADCVEMVCLKPYASPIEVSTRDVFLGSLWFHFFAARPLLEFQAKVRGGKRVPYVSLMQDYEASFSPWSSAFLLAQSMYDWDWPMIHLFNSAELRNYYLALGHVVRSSVTFEPTMNSFMAANLKSTPPRRKSRKIMFYGRPTARRNCFFLAREALDEWSVRYENASAWEVVSVGQAYDSFKLRGGGNVKVLGKLSLDQYCDELRTTAVGLSLMASPHPSYPPLEMAHFGAITLTNSFFCKNLATWHENIVSLDVGHPEVISGALIDACRRYDENPETGLHQRSLKPAYLEGFDQKCLTDAAKLVLSAFD